MKSVESVDVSRLGFSEGDVMKVVVVVVVMKTGEIDEVLRVLLVVTKSSGDDIGSNGWCWEERW